MNLNSKHPNPQPHLSKRIHHPQGILIKTTEHRHSHSVSEIEREDDERDAASTLYERRRVARVTLFEVDSGSLFSLAPKDLTVEEILSEGKEKNKEVARWAWPEGFPEVDGVLLCYDASDEKSIVGLEELCGKQDYSRQCQCSRLIYVIVFPYA